MSIAHNDDYVGIVPYMDKWTKCDRHQKMAAIGNVLAPV